ncbi:MAG: HD domain-containing protein [bacterium P3]|nr:MAG: HD domain-containing protein [bacterium P3]KWW42159.1 MAG: HD domain-containing protein [bacterium F083]
MSENFIDSSLLDRAICFAVQAHAGTERRGKGFPYIVHPLEVVSIVAGLTADQELLAAAVLHDTVEDTDTSLETLQNEFGARVASVVGYETAPKQKGLSWRERKQVQLDLLHAAPREGKIVAIGDKLSNMRAIAADYRRMGDNLWGRFHAPGGKSDIEWYYRGLAVALSVLAGTDAYTEFTDRLAEVFGPPKPERIDMAEYEESGDGYTATSYNHRDGRRMIKLYADFIPSHVPMQELQRTWTVLNMGLHVPRAYRMVTDGKRVGVEFERIAPKRSFARAISQQPDRLEHYAVAFARECRKLHGTQCNTNLLEPAVDYFRQDVAKAKKIDNELKRRIDGFLCSVPSDVTCLHGDLHIGNIITNDTENWWIDLGDFRYGSPWFDLGMFNMACNVIPDDLAMHLYHIPKSAMQEVWRIFIREYFESEPAMSIEEVERKVKPYTALYQLHFGEMDELHPPMREYIEKAFAD